MPRHSFIRMFKLTDVRGRVDYISNPKRQELLYATFASVAPEFWNRLSDQAQFDFKKSNQKEGKCTEARELVIALPESLQSRNPDDLLTLFTGVFRKKYGMECAAALHHNKEMTNYHIHLIFADREQLQEREMKIASRNMFYDENGHHVRTKKEILDADGNLRPGCRILKKGEPYEVRYFSERKDEFKRKAFLHEVKVLYTELINLCVRDERDRLKVFDPTGPYLPTKKIGKNNPKAKYIRAENHLRSNWNQTVDQVLIAGGSVEEVTEFKKSAITKPAAESIRTTGSNPNHFMYLLRAALIILTKFLDYLMQEQEEQEISIEADSREPEQNVVKEEITDLEFVASEITAPDDSSMEHQILVLQADYQHMKSIHDKLVAANNKVYAIDQSIKNLEKQLKAIPKGFFHRRDRKVMTEKIQKEKLRLKEACEYLSMIPSQYGFGTVRDVEASYYSAKARYEEAVEERNKNLHTAPGLTGERTIADDNYQSYGGKSLRPKSKESDPEKRKSVRERLAEKQRLVDERSGSQRSKMQKSNVLEL